MLFAKIFPIRTQLKQLLYEMFLCCRWQAGVKACYRPKYSCKRARGGGAKPSVAEARSLSSNRIEAWGLSSKRPSKVFALSRTKFPIES